MDTGSPGINKDALEEHGESLLGNIRLTVQDENHVSLSRREFIHGTGILQQVSGMEIQVLMMLWLQAS